MWTATNHLARTALLALLLSAAGSPARAQDYYGRMGVALKSGAAAGPMGIQLAWNFSPHWQICAGGGGTSDVLTLLDRDRPGNSFSRTDSYFTMGKYYLDHVFFETGYALKVAKSESVQSERARVASRVQHAVPMHIGYEFGHRRGFYFASSVGYFLGVGGRSGGLGFPGADMASLTGYASADSGPTVGLSVGYYLY
ncbi:MAG TPA: hypothetical protein VJ385_14340 [Fibrobacteria bacterium]|nr:hypothetical protein [Fibrobacteria bacterium]